MRRGLGAVLALGLLVGGAAACGDDDADGGDDATESTATAGGGDSAAESTTTAADGGAAGGGETDTTAPAGDDDVVAANDAVIQEYCDAVEANNAALDATLADPEDGAAQDALEEASGRLGEASDAVAPVVETFTPEQQAQFEECTDALGG